MFPKSDWYLNEKTQKVERRPFNEEKDVSRFSNLPNSRFIAGSAKRESLTLSIRIDEMTYGALDLIAKQNDVSLSKFLSNLLDYYAKQEYDEGRVGGSVYSKVMQQYLDRLEFKVKKLTAKDLKNHMPDEEYGRETGQNFFSTGNIAVYVADGPDCSYTNTKSFSDDELNMVGFNDFVLRVPAEKFALVDIILGHFYEKRRNLYSYRSDKQNLFSEREVKKVAQAVNEAKNKTSLISILIKTLKEIC